MDILSEEFIQELMMLEAKSNADYVEKNLIDEVVRIRNEQSISQSKLARLTGKKQQVISRIENRKHSPSLNLFCCIVHALGYDLKLEKKGKQSMVDSCKIS